MILYDVKLNGFVNPVGYLFEELVCSWKVAESVGTRQTNAKIEVASEPDFLSPILVREGSELCSNGEPISLQLTPRTRYYWRVTVTSDAGETAVSDICFFETAKMDEPWEGKWIGMQENEPEHPVFLRQFSCAKPVKQARLYICGLGLFEAYLNGSRAGNDMLAPFINDYYTHVQYCTYDVTDAVSRENTLKVWLANGWFKGRYGVTGTRSLWGKEFTLLAEFHITYIDGTEETVSTDDTWEYESSIYEETDIYDGEIQNHLRWQQQENPRRKARCIPAPAKLVERYSLPLHPMERLTVKELIHTPAGETVLDFGQNFAGFVECTQPIPRGVTMTLECGEVLQKGNFYHDNYKGAKSRFVYVSDGENRLIYPHFTFFGFRYIRVTGLENVDPSCFTGRPLHSELPRIGYLETSHAGLNRLYENTVWGLKSNSVDQGTDCPQRDERLMWLGDVLNTSWLASYHMDMRAFYRKVLRDTRTDQLRNNGMVGFYIPNDQPGITSSPGADVATLLPMNLYNYYGSKEVLRLQYPLMRDWVEYIRKRDEARGAKYLYDFDQQLGDWVALDGAHEQSVYGRTDEYYISSMYWYKSAALTAEAAGILGYTADAETYTALAGRIREAILQEYFTPSGRLSVDTQSGYLISLLFGVYREKEPVLNAFRHRMLRDCWRIKSGLGLAFLLGPVLAENGMVDEMYDLLFFEGFPGWLYSVNLGATTLWERWNSLLPDGTVSGTSMNSMNHTAIGSIVEFFYRYTAGIYPLEPGFRKIRLAPKPNWRLHHTRCSYDSASGKYTSCWRFNEDGSFTLEAEVPFGCTAVVELPDSETPPFEVTAGKYVWTYRPKRDHFHPYDEHTRIEVLSHDPNAMEVLRQYLPKKYDSVLTDNIEEMACTMQDELDKAAAMDIPAQARARMQETALLDMLFIRPEEVKKAIEAIKTVKVDP